MNIEELEVQVFQKILVAEEIIEKINRLLARQVINKSKEINLELTQELKDKCYEYYRFTTEKKFHCRICNKAFECGRQLGGHMSRSHKTK
jgi:hypothetical protein